jgi:lysozyme family protein
MLNVETIARQIVAREGGYADDPDDPGGPTKHGVTLTTLRRLGRDLDGDGAVDLSDLRRLDPDQAAQIFLEHYFRRPRLADLPEALQPPVFDMFVNSGQHAVEILQKLLVDMGQSVAVDGIVGPQTAAAAALAQAAAPRHLTDAYGIARRNWYYALADRRPPLRKFARRRDGGKGGWIRRAESFVSARYHLTEAEHRARVAAWG